MKISIFSLFRDSAKTMSKTLSMLNLIEKCTDASFEYFFYENDSKDNTLSILENWSKNKIAKIKSENLNAEKFGSTLHQERMIHMSKIRNKMLNLGINSNSDFSVILDSDVTFYPEIINDFLNFKDLNFSMLTPNIRQNVPCKMGSGCKTSYYDSSILFDTNGLNCMTWSNNPFLEDEDREKFENLEPIEVSRAFGGFALLKSKHLFQCNWDSKGESEHFSLCDKLIKFGKIYLIPSIQPSVHVSKQHWEHENLIVERQNKILSTPWNRFLLKTGNTNLV